MWGRISTISTEKIKKISDFLWYIKKCLYLCKTGINHMANWQVECIENVFLTLLACCHLTKLRRQAVSRATTRTQAVVKRIILELYLNFGYEGGAQLWSCAPPFYYHPAPPSESISATRPAPHHPTPLPLLKQTVPGEDSCEYCNIMAFSALHFLFSINYRIFAGWKLIIQSFN